MDISYTTEGSNDDLITSVVGFLSILAALFVVWYQIKAKRNDDKFTSQLGRLNTQLSKLYGPLYALYRTGDKQWRQFLVRYSNHPDAKHPDFPYLGFFPEKNNIFTEPNAEQLRIFRLWTENVFLITNTKIEDIIINNADLMVGKKIPKCFLKFCIHMASFKASVADWKTDPEFKVDVDWRRHMSIFPHPGGTLDNYIEASFTVLKQKQSDVLFANAQRKRKGFLNFSTAQDAINIDENELNYKIKKKIKKIKKKNQIKWIKFIRNKNVKNWANNNPYFYAYGVLNLQVLPNPITFRKALVFHFQKIFLYFQKLFRINTSPETGKWQGIRLKVDLTRPTQLPPILP